MVAFPIYLKPINKSNVTYKIDEKTIFLAPCGSSIETIRRSMFVKVSHNKRISDCTAIFASGSIPFFTHEISKDILFFPYELIKRSQILYTQFIDNTDKLEGLEGLEGLGEPGEHEFCMLEYFRIVEALLEHTSKQLTEDAMIRYMLDSTNTTSAVSVLYIYRRKSVSPLLLNGLKEFFGKDFTGKCIVVQDDADDEYVTSQITFEDGTFYDLVIYDSHQTRQMVSINKQYYKDEIIISEQ